MESAKSTQLFELKLNGKSLGKVQGDANTKREHIIDYLKQQGHTFDPAKDILEVTNVTPEAKGKSIRHPSRDKSANNKYVDAILSRHVANILATYGEDRFFKILQDVHGLVKPEKKAG